MDFEITPLTDKGVPRVVALCRDALDLPEDAAEAAPIVARLREQPGIGFLATLGEDTVGAVLGSVSHRDPTVGHIDLVAVHPDARRRGLGRALIGRIEAALAGRGASDVLLAGNPPYYAWPGIDVRYTPAVCLAMALGFEEDRTAWNMTADLSRDDAPGLRPTDAAERRLAAEGITVRRAEPEDIATLVEFTRVTFGGSWTGEVEHSVDRAGAGCFFAVRDSGEILGFAAYGSSRPTWFGPMGTAPAAQGLGIGSVLIRSCLREQRAAGITSAEIGWVGPVPFYARTVGARIQRVFFLYRKQL
ncbi:GNAT family N-acetyltransferase [Actinomycetes bacterium KLBMP 9797]